MKRLSTQGWPVKDEVTRQLRGEVLSIRSAATIPAEVDAPSVSITIDQVLSDCGCRS
jgi:hypothetical protein